MYERHNAHALPVGSADDYPERSAGEAAGVQRDKLKSLTGSTEWGMVLAFIDDQCRRRVHEIMTTVESDEASKQKVTFSKGEYNGMQIVKLYVEQQLSAAEDLVELYKEHAKLENANG